MTVKTQLIAATVRLLAENNILFRKPDPITELFGGLFAPAGDTYDVRIAKDVEVQLDRVIDRAKRIRTNRQFKKVTKDF